MTDEDTLRVRLRPEIVAVPAYKQGRPAPADGFKLSSNENPYPPLPSVVEAVTATLADLNRYPNAGGADLRERLAVRHGVGVDQVHLGSGSVSLLAQFIMAAAGPGDEVVYSWRSFEAYPGLVTVAGATSVLRAADKLGQMAGPLVVGALFGAHGLGLGLALTGGIYLAATALFLLFAPALRARAALPSSS